MAKREVVRKPRFTNPLLLESLNRIEQTGYSQPRNPNNRNLNSEIGSNVYLSPSESLLLSPKYNPSNNFNNSLLSSKINPDLSIPLERPEIINNLGLMGASTMLADNSITLDEAKKTEEKINKTIVDEGTDLNKHTGLGNMLARLGGAQIATEEERAAATPELRELYNQKRLAARNKGIGQMLFALSDALGGRDVVGRFVDRQDAMQPEEESAREQINQELLSVYRALEKVDGDASKLPPYEKAIYDVRIANQTGYNFPFLKTNNANQSNNQNEEEDEADRIAQKYLQPS